MKNDVRARFRFADGLIAEHDDAFSFYAWSRQALGAAGLLLGWTPLLRALGAAPRARPASSASWRPGPEILQDSLQRRGFPARLY